MWGRSDAVGSAVEHPVARAVSPAGPNRHCTASSEQRSDALQRHMLTRAVVYSAGVRRSIARVLTVINSKQRQSLREFYKKKAFLPLDLRPKKTRAIRKRLTKVSVNSRLCRAMKQRAGTPSKLWAKSPSARALHHERGKLARAPQARSGCALLCNTCQAGPCCRSIHPRQPAKLPPPAAQSAGGVSAIARSSSSRKSHSICCCC